MRITTPTLFVFTLMLSIILMPSGFILAQEHDSEAADSENTTSDSVDFATYVMPLLSRLGCNATACHGAAIGKGGLKLSMFGAEPQQDYDTLTRAAGARRINRVEPLESLMLLKASQRIPHGGGKKIEVDSPEYQNLARWIAAGAPWGDADGPTLVSIRVAPEEQTLAKDATHQLRATAVFSDDTERDVTGAAQYRSSDEAVATVDADGTVQAKQFGESIVVVTYMRRGGVVRVLVPQPLSDEFPNVEVYNKVDELVVAKLKKLGLPPSELCSDEEFLRRVYLDVIGTLPTSDETRAFLADTDAERRAKLIDRLLDRSEFADWWALKWGDLLRVKSEFPANLWPNAVQAYHRWIKNSIAQNKPYDQFVRELITSSGSNFRSPAVNYYRSIPGRDAESFAEVTSLLFTGMRLECARCHGHPYEDWGVDDSAGMAAFFAQVTFKNTSEWKEEVVYANPKRTFRHPVTRELVAPKMLGGEVVEIPKDEDPRLIFAERFTSPDNPWFARSAVNRVWFWLFGRGIVHEVDDLRPTNPPENPELLDYLAKELVDSGHDLKHIFRLILNSRTYQLSSKPKELNAWDEGHFSRYRIKRLTAEQVLDAVGQVTGTSERYSSRIPEPYTYIPENTRSMELFDGSIGNTFLNLFGRPSRDTAYESDRCSDASMGQTLHFVNSTHIHGKVVGSPTIKQLLQSGKTNAEIVEELYLSALSRFPTEEEKQQVLDYIGEDKNLRTQSVQDLAWAILNTKEFLFNH